MRRGQEDTQCLMCITMGPKQLELSDMLSVEHKWLSDFSVYAHVLGSHQAAIFITNILWEICAWCKPFLKGRLSSILCEITLCNH